MKKAARALLLFGILACLFLSTAYASSVPAEYNYQSIAVDDSFRYAGGYTIGGSNYFRIRDLAALLERTSCRFDVTWNRERQTVELKTGAAYTGESGDGGYDAPLTAQAVPSQAGLLIDGAPAAIQAYTIGGSNYYRLRDLGELLGFDVYWDGEKRQTYLYTFTADAAGMLEASGLDRLPARRTMDVQKSTDRRDSLSSTFLYADDGETFSVLTCYSQDLQKHICVDTYSRDSRALLSSREIPMELDVFAGFYAGKTCNYMVFGQNNTEENDGREVIRVVKYDKDFRRLDQLSVTGGESFTVEPFRSGSLRMEEQGNELVVHTSRKRYTTSDGLNHQSQLTLVVDTERMTLKNKLGQFQANHVSHSFAQFVRYDGSQHVLLDLGDAYPRSVVLHRGSGSSYTETELLKIPGDTGANCTGVMIGGLEITGSGCLAAVNCIDHSKVSRYTSFEMEGLGLDERNVVLLSCNKQGGDVRQSVLTDYIGRGKLGSVPYLVKLSEDRFLVLWEEFTYTDGGKSSQDDGVRYVVVNGRGEPAGAVQSLPHARLPLSCQPVCLDGQVMWFVDTRMGRVVYAIEA